MQIHTSSAHIHLNRGYFFWFFFRGEFVSVSNGKTHEQIFTNLQDRSDMTQGTIWNTLGYSGSPSRYRIFPIFWGNSCLLAEIGKIYVRIFMKFPQEVLPEHVLAIYQPAVFLVVFGGQQFGSRQNYQEKPGRQQPNMNAVHNKTQSICTCIWLFM